MMELEIFWKRFGRFGVTKGSLAYRLGIKKQSLYNWNTVPRHLVFALEILEEHTDIDYDKLRRDSEELKELKIMLDNESGVIGESNECNK